MSLMLLLKILGILKSDSEEIAVVCTRRNCDNTDHVLVLRSSHYESNAEAMKDQLEARRGSARL